MFDLELNIHKKPTSTDLLLAEPFLRDSNFDRSVILLCEHRQKGSFGLILNRPTDLYISQALNDWPLGAQDFRLFSGGPVEQNALYFIHRLPEISHSLPLREGWYLGGEFEMIQQLATQYRISEENCRFFVGYSGWGAEQLNQEIEEQSWIISKASLTQTMALDKDETMWKDVLQNMGGRYRMFANYPKDPSQN